MLGFWAIVAVFVVIVFAFLLPPLLRTRDVIGIVARKDLTVSVYQDQFEELDNDLKNEVISQDQYEQAKIDLEKNLLEDMGKADQLDAIEKASASPVSNKIVAGVIVLIVPIASVLLYNSWGSGAAALDPDFVPQVAHNEQHSENIESMLGTLITRLEENPSDGEGWYMLGKTYQFLKRYTEAAGAFERSLPLGGDQSADILASYADVLAMAANRVLTTKAIEALKQALTINPNHVNALWMMATSAHQRENYRESLSYWERLIKVLPAGSEEANQVTSYINDVRSLLGMSAMPDVTKSSAEASMPAVISDARIQGSISLSDELVSQVLPEDTVFVFARAATGSRMPLAIVRKQVKDIPFDFTLDDSQAMSASTMLSSASQVIVGARVSKTGNAMPQPGDLEGMSDVIDVSNSAPLNLIINKVIQ